MRASEILKTTFKYCVANFHTNINSVSFIGPRTMNLVNFRFESVIFHKQ